MNTKDMEMYQLYSNPETREEAILKACELIESPVRMMVLNYYPKLYNSNYYEDLLQECKLEVIRIFPKYNLKKNSKFITYCFPYLKHAIVQYVDKNINYTSTYYRRRYGNGIEIDRTYDMSFCEFLDENIENMADDMENKKMAEEFLSCLNPKHQYLLRSYYGVGRQEKSAKTLAEELGMTTEQINWMKQDCIKKMRKLIV